MVYLLGLNLSEKIPVGLGLQQVYGIGKKLSKKLCEDVEVEYWSKLGVLSEDKIRAISRLVRRRHIIGVELKREVYQSIRKKMDNRSYKGLRHRYGLPVNGQRTRSNALTSKTLLRKGVDKV